MGEYLYQHQPKLMHNKIDIQDALEESILYGSIIREDGTIIIE